MARAKSSIFNFTLLETKSTLTFPRGHNVPFNYMYFPLINSGAPNKVSLDFIDIFSDFIGYFDVLHDM